jgi:hypothetical protein
VITAATAATAPGATSDEPAPNVPDVFAESQKAAHASPEAAVDTEVVGEKKAVEAELLAEVPKVEATGEPAPVIAADSSDNKAALSNEALVDTAPLKSSSEVDGLNAPASKPAQVVEPTPFKPIDANTDVSYASKEPAVAEPTTTDQTKPTVTTGTATTATEATSGTAVTAPTEATSSTTPATPKKDADGRKDSDVSPKGTPGSQSIASGTADDKKKKRRSIFGKIKDKLSSKH